MWAGWQDKDTASNRGALQRRLRCSKARWQGAGSRVTAQRNVAWATCEVRSAWELQLGRGIAVVQNQALQLRTCHQSGRQLPQKVLVLLLHRIKHQACEAGRAAAQQRAQRRIHAALAAAAVHVQLLQPSHGCDRRGVLQRRQEAVQEALAKAQCVGLPPARDGGLQELPPAGRSRIYVVHNKRGFAGPHVLQRQRPQLDAGQL